MNTFFTPGAPVEEIKQAYRRLAMRHHPDRGGCTETMQALNQQYQAALQSCHGTSSVGDDGADHTYYYRAAAEHEIMDKISAFCGLGMVDVEIALIGTWVWIQGNTKPHKDALKSFGCHWHRRRSCWYWHPPQKRRSRASPGSLEEIARKYGYQSFESEESDRVKAG